MWCVTRSSLFEAAARPLRRSPRRRTAPIRVREEPADRKHIRLTSAVRGYQHHVTLPRHDALKVGTLAAILSDVAEYLELDRADLVEQLLRR